MFLYNPLGQIKNSTARFRPRSPWSSRTGHRNGLRSEERLGVYGERYFGVPSKVLLLCNLQCSLNALGLHRHAETSSAATCLDRNPHHSSAPLCAQTSAPLHANALVTFCIIRYFRCETATKCKPSDTGFAFTYDHRSAVLNVYFSSICT